MRPPGPLAVKIGLPAVECLGTGLHGGLVPAASDMAANSWDADAKSIEIALLEGPTADGSAVIAGGGGAGMSCGDMAAKHLRTGRKRRIGEGGGRALGGRKVTGRKGIGRPSVLGAANNAWAGTAKGGARNTIAVSMDGMPRRAGRGGYCGQDIVEHGTAAKGGGGTRITLAGPKRKTPAGAGGAGRCLSRRFSAMAGALAWP